MERVEVGLGTGWLHPLQGIILILTRSCFLHYSSLSFLSPDCSSFLRMLWPRFPLSTELLAKGEKFAEDIQKQKYQPRSGLTWGRSFWRTIFHSAIGSKQAELFIILWHSHVNVETEVSTSIWHFWNLSWKKCLNRDTQNEKELTYHC